MKWSAPLVEATFLRRYKRFLADFRLADGTVVTGHCANTGSMRTCLHEGARVWLTYHDDPKRKLAYSWQAIQMPDGWVGIHTGLANHLVAEAIENGTVTELQGYGQMVREQRYGDNSRIDLLLRDAERPDCYVEVKNVTLQLDEGIAAFPDAVTKRGHKHLRELQAVAAAGSRAVLLFCVQRASATQVRPADDDDPTYGQLLRTVAKAGVEVLAYAAAFNPAGIALTHPLPVKL